MEVKINNTTYQIKSGNEIEVRELFLPYKKDKHEIKELYELDLVRIIFEGIIYEISRRIFMEKIYPNLKNLTQETIEGFKTARWV